MRRLPFKRTNAPFNVTRRLDHSSSDDNGVSLGIVPEFLLTVIAVHKLLPFSKLSSIKKRKLIMTYRSRGRSIIEVVLVRSKIAKQEFVFFHHLAACAVQYSFPFLSHIFLSTLSAGNCLCHILGWIYYSPVYWKLLSSETSTRAAETEAIGQVGR